MAQELRGGFGVIALEGVPLPERTISRRLSHTARLRHGRGSGEARRV